VIASLNSEGYWPSLLRGTSHPYKGDGPKEVAQGDFSRTQVGDESDTSPYRSPERIMGISTDTYIRNMGMLIRYLKARQ